MASLWHTGKKDTLGREGNYKQCRSMYLKSGGEGVGSGSGVGLEEMCSDEVISGKE